MNKKYACPCCYFLTLSEAPPGTFEICPVCNWEDDDVQFHNQDYKGGANDVSLKEAKNNFKKYNASSMKSLKLVRASLDDEICRG